MYNVYIDVFICTFTVEPFLWLSELFSASAYWCYKGDVLPEMENMFLCLEGMCPTSIFHNFCS